MLFLVLPLLVFTVFVAFRTYPGENSSNGYLLQLSLLLVLLGPSALAVILVWIHAPLVRWAERRLPLSRAMVSASVGAVLGCLFGLLWSLTMYWGVGVALQGLSAGLLYGILVGLIARGSLLEPLV